MGRPITLFTLQVAGGAVDGFRTVLVSEYSHPFWEQGWPPGHIIGWEDTFVREIHHLRHAIAADGRVGPLGATFEDGYWAAEVCDAVPRSSQGDTAELVPYQEVERG